MLEPHLKDKLYPLRVTRCNACNKQIITRSRRSKVYHPQCRPSAYTPRETPARNDWHGNDKSAYKLIHDPSEWPLKIGMCFSKEEYIEMCKQGSFEPGTVVERAADGKRITIHHAGRLEDGQLRCTCGEIFTPNSSNQKRCDECRKRH